jgi:hypothetical protein
MPIFKTTKNILQLPDQDELFDPNWMDSDKLILPPKREWDYSRDLKIEDIDIWEQIFYMGGGLGLYAAWSPYAEFYLITHYQFSKKVNALETFYGPNASKNAYERGLALGMRLHLNKVWVDDDKMWLYTTPEPRSNTLILP